MRYYARRAGSAKRWPAVNAWKRHNAIVHLPPPKRGGVSMIERGLLWRLAAYAGNHHEAFVSVFASRRRGRTGP